MFVALVILLKMHTEFPQFNNRKLFSIYLIQLTVVNLDKTDIAEFSFEKSFNWSKAGRFQNLNSINKTKNIKQQEQEKQKKYKQI